MLFENDADARYRHWLVCQPLCLWTGGVNMAISTFETLPPSVLAVSPGEAPSYSAFMPASRIDGQSLPRGMCVSPSPRVVGIAPTPETSSQVVPSFLLVTWGPILRVESSVSGQRIAPPPGCWWARRRGRRESPRASPSPAAGDVPTSTRALKRGP